jgi:hypothetical protein
MKLGLPIWSQDKDLTDAGIEVFTTGELLDALADAGLEAYLPVGVRQRVALYRDLC